MCDTLERDRSSDRHERGRRGLPFGGRRWLKQAFPGKRIEDVVVLATAEPSRFEAALDSWAGFGKRLLGSAEVR
jgi:hypothetical protein